MKSSLLFALGMMALFLYGVNAHAQSAAGGGIPPKTSAGTIAPIPLDATGAHVLVTTSSGAPVLGAGSAVPGNQLSTTPGSAGSYVVSQLVMPNGATVVYIQNAAPVYVTNNPFLQPCNKVRRANCNPQSFPMQGGGF